MPNGYPPITPAQIRKIHTVRRHVPGLDEDAYRGLLDSRFNVDSTKDLTKYQAIRLIEYLEGNTPRKHVADRITGAQLAMLTDILAQCGMTGSKAACWARRYSNGEKIFNLDQLDKDQARLAIPAAQAMYREYHGVDHDPDAPRRERLPH